MRGAIWPFLPATTMAVMVVVDRWLLGLVFTVGDPQKLNFFQSRVTKKSKLQVPHHLQLLLPGK